MKNILEVDSVILEFNGHRILQNVYLRSETNHLTGLLGRNGTGKSCLMRIIVGDLTTNGNSVRINNQALIGWPRKTEDIRYLPQFEFIPNHLTIRRVFSDFNLDFREFLVHFSQFENRMNFKMRNLSKGERRIIELFVILVSDSKFVLLDEPFSQIMPMHLDVIKRLIKKEKQKKGIILTDHNYRHIVDVCDEIYVINNGITHLINNEKDLERLGYVSSGK